MSELRILKGAGSHFWNYEYTHYRLYTEINHANYVVKVQQ